MSNSIFHNKAIKFSSWDELIQLSVIALSEGEMVGELYKNRVDKLPYFSISSDGIFYSHYYGVYNNETEISFDQFFQSLNQK